MTTRIGTLPFDLQERLFTAARDGPVENIWALVKQGADVDRYGADGVTALHYAAFYGNVEAVRVILKLGGNAHARCVATEGHTEQAGFRWRRGATYVHRPQKEAQRYIWLRAAGTLKYLGFW
mmetsp:Transcript_9172/g.15744  ORF Transcript_9172/g.15744 Transcript_9172/m.15744 type:complete len:122 (+) Transcript_9172:377-742(+)